VHESQVEPESVAVECDQDARLLTLQSSTPTPAGWAGLDLGAGVEIDVDVARPAALAAITVGLPASGDPGVLPADVCRRLDALVGTERAAQLGAVVRESADRRSIARRTWSGTAGPSGAPGPALACLPDPLATAALAHAATWRPGAPRLARLAGLVEAAVALDGLGQPFDLRGVARGDLRLATDLVDDLLAHGDPVPDRQTARVLATELRRAAAIAGEGTAAATAFATLVPELERARGGLLGRDPRRARPGGDRSTSRGGEPGVGLAWRVAIDVRSLPGDLSDAAIAGRRSGPCEVEVLIHGWAERSGGLWARAFDAADDTVVGMGPVRRAGRDAVAHIIVPPVATSRIEVDVTDRPEMPRPSPALAVVERAISRGAAAAQAERLAETERAARRWQQCARAWDAVGDPVRGDQARAYAVHAASSAPGSAGRRIGPLLSDLAGRGQPA
jgi:hypothetical protein